MRYATDGPFRRRSDRERRGPPVGAEGGPLEAVAWHMRKFKPGRDGVIFTNLKGDWIRRISFGMAWRKIVERSGVERDGRISFHQLRHFYASALIAAGEEPTAVQEQMGHASLSMTLETYSHMFRKDPESIRRAIEQALRRPEDRFGTDKPRTWAENGPRNPWSGG